MKHTHLPDSVSYTRRRAERHAVECASLIVCWRPVCHWRQGCRHTHARSTPGHHHHLPINHSPPQLKHTYTLMLFLLPFILYYTKEVAFSTLTLLVGRLAGKKFSDVWCWQMICHCHSIISYLIKIQNGSAFLVFWGWLTQVELQRPLNGCFIVQRFLTKGNSSKHGITGYQGNVENSLACSNCWQNDLNDTMLSRIIWHFTVCPILLSIQDYLITFHSGVCVCVCVCDRSVDQ